MQNGIGQISDTVFILIFGALYCHLKDYLIFTCLAAVLAE